jgi:pimeloyl-ACP methyl ester carboxylesterase
MRGETVQPAPRWDREGRAAVARLRHLVVVLPGIGGSVLEEPGTDVARSTARYSLTGAALAKVVAAPRTLDVERFPNLVPTGLVRDFTALPPLWTLPGYQRLRLHLHNAFHDQAASVVDTYKNDDKPIHEETDVLLVPYDFRQSVVVAADRLDAAVTAALKQRPRPALDRPVIVIAHSMGGLVARHWIAVGEGWKRCKALITLGTPYRGAPKALDWLVNGAGRPGLRHPGLTAVIRRWPSMYELLPQYEAVWDAAEEEPFELTELPASLLAARPRLARYADTFTTMASAGRRIHEQITTEWADLVAEGRAPTVVPFFARGHATPNLLTLTTSGRLRITKEDPPWRGNVGWAGDGTVPALCAIPHELGRREDAWRVLTVKHGPLGSVANPMQLLVSYAGDTVPVRGGPLPDRPWLGLDVDEFTAVGQEVTVRARLLPAPLTGQTAEITVTPLDDTPGTVCNVGLAPADDSGDGQAWHGIMPPRQPGRYELSVEVRGVPQWGTVATTDTLVVLDTATERDHGWSSHDVDDEDG